MVVVTEGRVRMSHGSSSSGNSGGGGGYDGDGN